MVIISAYVSLLALTLQVDGKESRAEGWENRVRVVVRWRQDGVVPEKINHMYKVCFSHMHSNIHIYIQKDMSIYKHIYISVCASIYLPIYLSMYLYVCISLQG